MCYPGFEKKTSNGLDQRSGANKANYDTQLDATSINIDEGTNINPLLPIEMKNMTTRVRFKKNMFLFRPSSVQDVLDVLL